MRTPREMVSRCALVMLLTLLGEPLLAAPAAAASPRAPVLIAVTDITPGYVPQPTHKVHRIVFHLSLTNTTGLELDDVQIQLRRDYNPITGTNAQRQLDDKLADRTPDDTGLTIPPIHPKHPPTVDLPADGTSVSASFATTTGLDDNAQLCVCAPNGIYPLYFTARTKGSAGILGSTTTFVPSVYDPHVAKVGVAWVWPLLERPHRLTHNHIFVDDALATSVADGGQLSRALAVVEDVGGDIPLTLVVDPELLDELEVMKTGRYTVQPTAKAKPTRGTGGPAAAAWLARLQTVLQDDPGVTVELTPYADPDVETLSRQGLTWTSGLPAVLSGRVQEALAGRVPSNAVAWPAAPAVSLDTMSRLAADGSNDVLLSSASVTPRLDPSGVLTSVARISTDHGAITAGVTSPAIEQDAAAAIGTGGSSALPDLFAELTVRAVQQPTSRHVVVITAPRELNASPADAARAIRVTSQSRLTEPVSLAAALHGPATAMSAKMAKPTRQPDSLPTATTDAAREVAGELSTVTSLLAASRAARPLLVGLPLAVQRIESSAWRTHPTQGRALAGQLTALVATLLTGVHIVTPSSSGTGSYTLASRNSPLPITVQNDLPYAVRIKVSVSTVNGLPGLPKVERESTIDPQSKAALRLRTHVDRPGRILVEAQLYTPNNDRLGDSVELSVRSTVLGLIGVIITIVAGAVLALALLIRLWRRLRARRLGPPPVPAPDDAAAIAP